MKCDHSALLVALVVFAAGCNRQPPPPPGNPAPPAPKISVVKPEMRPVKREVEQPGVVQPYEETALYANVRGFVGERVEDPEKVERIKQNRPDKVVWPEHDRYFDIDSRVKKDQVLARLVVPELEEEQKQKDALVKQTEAEVTQALKADAAARAAVAASEAFVTEAEAGVDRAQALYVRAQKEFTHVQKLLSGGVGDELTRDEVESKFKAAEASRREANAKVTSAKAAVKKAEADGAKAVADIETAKARVEVAKAEASRVKTLRAYTEIKAPFDGVVTRRTVNTRDLVGSGESRPLFSVARLDPVRVVVQVPEADAGLVESGLTVRFALAGAEQMGKVIRTSWSLEPGSRTLRTEIDLPNKEGKVRPGMYVHAKLVAELPAAWSIPVAAVGKVNDEPVIYLVEGGKAARVIVDLHRGDSQFTQIRRYKKPGASDWTEVTGSESVATPASALTDGQAVQ
jgi:HlyD family secretion protein